MMMKGERKKRSADDSISYRKGEKEDFDLLAVCIQLEAAALGSFIIHAFLNSLIIIYRLKIAFFFSL